MEDLNVGVEGHVFDFDFVVDGEGVVGHVDFSFLGFSFLLDRRSFDSGGLTVITGNGDFYRKGKIIWNGSCDCGGALRIWRFRMLECTGSPPPIERIEKRTENKIKEGEE